MNNAHVCAAHQFRTYCVSSQVLWGLWADTDDVSFLETLKASVHWSAVLLLSLQVRLALLEKWCQTQVFEWKTCLLCAVTDQIPFSTSTQAVRSESLVDNCNISQTLAKSDKSWLYNDYWAISIRISPFRGNQSHLLLLSVQTSLWLIKCHCHSLRASRSIA